jgi:hypothetical protein
VAALFTMDLFEYLDGKRNAKFRIDDSKNVGNTAAAD